MNIVGESLRKKEKALNEIFVSHLEDRQIWVQDGNWCRIQLYLAKIQVQHQPLKLIFIKILVII